MKTDLNIYLKSKYKGGMGWILLLNGFMLTAWIAFIMCFTKMHFSFKNRPEILLFSKIPFGNCFGWGLFCTIFSTMQFIAVFSDGILLYICLCSFPMLFTSIYILSYQTSYKFRVNLGQKIIDYINMNKMPISKEDLSRYLAIPLRSDKLISESITDLSAIGIIEYKQIGDKYNIKILVPELVVNIDTFQENENASLVDCKYCGATGQGKKCKYCGSELY